MWTSNSGPFTWSEEINNLCKKIMKNKSLSIKNLIVDPYINNIFEVMENVHTIHEFTSHLLNQKAGTIISGSIQINVSNYNQAFVGDNCFIESMQLRQFAMNGDTVKAFVFHQHTTGKIKAKGFVIEIINRNYNSRQIQGHFLKKTTSYSEYLNFQPTSKSIPCIRIYKNRDRSFEPNESMLYLADITDWIEGGKPVGEIIYRFGDREQLQTLNTAILYENGLNIADHVAQINGNLVDFTIPAVEYLGREKLSLCTFTIDSKGSHEIDDAISVNYLPNGNYEIGVHISDVSYFIKENTNLDSKAQEQGTSIYMANKAYSMLPKWLWKRCSLTPGDDKLTFSVFVQMTKEGELISTRFAKTIINSCTQLTYSNATQLIDEPDCYSFAPDTDFPFVKNGYSMRNVSESVNTLYRLAMPIRQLRSKKCVTFHKQRLEFVFDHATGNPISLQLKKEQSKSDILIEEYMLLANQMVAKHLFNTKSKQAIFLRNLPPKEASLAQLRANMLCYDIHLKFETREDITESYYQILKRCETSNGTSAVLVNRLARSMNRSE